MNDRFLIQVLKRNAEPNIKVMILNSAGDAKDWENYPHSYNTYENAVKECELLIKNGSYRANEVRIVEVVGTFESEVYVSTKSHKNK